MENYNNYLINNGKSSHTIKQYLHVAKLFIDWHIQHTSTNPFDPTLVSGRDLQEFKSYLINDSRTKRKTKLSVNTVINYIESLKAYFGYLQDNQIIKSNPALNLKAPTIQKGTRKPKSLTKIERNQLLRYINDPDLKLKNPWRFTRNRAIVFCMLHGGLRIHEVTSLFIFDVNFINLTLSVLGKGNKLRYVPINTSLKIALKEWIEERNKKGTQSDYLFTSQKSNQFTDDGVQFLFKKIRQETALPDLTPHVLRHTCAYDLMKKGTPLGVIADVLGHSSTDITRIYTTGHYKDIHEYVNLISDD